MDSKTKGGSCAVNQFLSKNLLVSPTCKPSMDLISSWSSLSTLKYTLRNFLDSLGLQHTEYGLEEGLSKLWAQDNLSIFCLNPVYGLDFKNQDPHACPGLEAVCLDSDVRPHACGRLAKLGSQHLNAKEMRKNSSLSSRHILYSGFGMSL